MPTLQIRLLGHFQLIYDGTPINSIKGPRLQALLSYLIFHRDRAHERQRVADFFWPERAGGQQRSNLSNKLSLLRKKFPALEDFLYVDEDILQWRMDAAFTLDIADFEQALEQVEQAKRQQDNATVIGALKAAIASYTRDLLVKLQDDWVLATRHRLRNQFLFALESLILVLKSQHDYATAIYYAQRRLQENHNEAAYRQLIELHFLNENYASAMQVYQTCKTFLQHELKRAPGPATEAIHQQVVAAVAHATQTIPPLTLTASPLAGGSIQELQRLATVWLDDHASLHPFSGVTYFLAQLAVQLALQGESTEALLILDRAFLLLTATGEVVWEAELHRLRGKLLWQQAKPLAEIEECFLKAIAIARHQNAKFLELRAVANLCLLLKNTERQALVRQQLADLYAIFCTNYSKAELEVVLAIFEEFM